MVWRSILVQPYRSTDGGGWKHGLAPRLRARGTPPPLFKPERDPPPGQKDLLPWLYWLKEGHLCLEMYLSFLIVKVEEK